MQDSERRIRNVQELEFAVFCIENLAERVATDGREIYDPLTERSDILHGYIVPEYEALHTQSKEYIIDDIIGLMRERGIEI